jgi:hypothetical protein
LDPYNEHDSIHSYGIEPQGLEIDSVFSISEERNLEEENDDFDVHRLYANLRGEDDEIRNNKNATFKVNDFNIMAQGCDLHDRKSSYELRALKSDDDDDYTPLQFITSEQQQTSRIASSYCFWNIDKQYCNKLSTGMRNNKDKLQCTEINDESGDDSQWNMKWNADCKLFETIMNLSNYNAFQTNEHVPCKSKLPSNFWSAYEIIQSDVLEVDTNRNLVNFPVEGNSMTNLIPYASGGRKIKHT